MESPKGRRDTAGDEKKEEKQEGERRTGREVGGEEKGEERRKSSQSEKRAGTVSKPPWEEGNFPGGLSSSGRE